MPGLPAPAERLALLSEEARKHAGRTRPPVDAATLILIDRKESEPRMLMGRRHANHRFMPDVFVFPGGRSEAGDSRVTEARPLAPDTLAALMLASPRANPTRMRRLALAAIRETFEETGLVIGQRCASPEGLKGPWAEFAATGHLPDLSRLTYIARAITPPRRPKRFDTRFFVADAAAISFEVKGIVTPESELTELAWLTFDETEKLPLPVITRVMLGELKNWLDTQASASPAPIPFYFERHGRMQRLLLDQNGAAGSGPL
jgi:8-oxo-dGTP pyrophosphatase MutT (NUDIX family)